MSFENKPKVESDYVIMQSDTSSGKLKIVGRAWKKTGKTGSNFVSLSIGPQENRQSYLMFKNDKEKRPDPAVRTGPPKQMPEKYTPPAPVFPREEDFDL